MRNLKEDMQGRKQLSCLVVQCFNTLDTYGKPPEAMESIVKIFHLILGRFSIKVVEEAFRAYLESNTVMPKPADIVKIIEPPVAPLKWCKVTFLEIKRKKRENVFTTDEENQYCRDLVDAQVNTLPDERLAISDAVKQAAIEDQRYWRRLTQ